MVDVGEQLEITDFRLAGFLVARGAKFTSTSTNVKNEVMFIFDNRPNKDGLTAVGILHMFPGSPEQQYDAACRTMHDLVKMLVPRGPTKHR